MTARDGTVGGGRSITQIGVARVLAVGLGGLLGTLLRVGVVEVAPRVAALGVDEVDDAATAVVAILVVNLVGALVLGVVAGRVTGDVTAHFVMTGILGSFTTFSSFVVDTVAMADRGVAWGWILAYLVVTVVGGLGCARLGLRLGARHEHPVSVSGGDGR